MVWYDYSMDIKHCGKCDNDFPATNEFFYKNKAKPDGLATPCRACSKEAAGKFYEKNKIKINKSKKKYWSNRYFSEKEAKGKNKTPDVISAFKDTDLAYFAGLIDGEGSFGIIKPVGKVHIPVMSIAMNCETTIARFAKFFSVTYSVVIRKEPQHMPGYVTKITGKRLVLFCEKSLPYFVTKKTHAEMMIRFGLTYIYQKGNGEPLPGWVVDERSKIKSILHQLNRPYIYGPYRPLSEAVEGSQ